MKEQKSCPWLSQKTLQINIPRFRLHQEIIEFYNYIKPSEQEHKQKLLAFNELKLLLQNKIEKIEIKEFGSFAVQLYLPNSDIDLVVININKNSQNLMMKVANILWQNEDRYQQVELIRSAKVPIIKMKDIKYNYEFDIAFNQLDGVTHLQEVKKVLNEYPEAKYLIMILKCILKQRKLNETYSGGIGSYLLFCMILTYLRENRKKLIQNQQIDQLQNMTLSDYLLGLFQFYTLEFNDKDSYIVMNNGGEIKNKTQNQDYNFSLISPQEQTHDIGSAAFRIKDVFAFFKNRFTFLINYNFNPDESILKYVVNPSSMPFNFFNNQFRKII